MAELKSFNGVVVSTAGGDTFNPESSCRLASVVVHDETEGTVIISEVLTGKVLFQYNAAGGVTTPGSRCFSLHNCPAITNDGIVFTSVSATVDIYIK